MFARRVVDMNQGGRSDPVTQEKRGDRGGRATDAQGIRHARLVNAADPTERKTLAADVLTDPSRFEELFCDASPCERKQPLSQMRRRG